MVDTTQSEGGRPPESGDGEEKLPFMQRLLDNPFILLFLGVFIPAILYLMWGIVELANIPLAK